jgi:poly-gamma-glutamate synthesis protein (capsule biosynthesis protein)
MPRADVVDLHADRARSTKMTIDPGEVLLATKVSRLRDPAAWPEPTTRVEAIETHMAWVFLTDRHAYKLKKPVRYEFLDFSTLERRRAMCQEEVRINRMAPSVYLGIVSLTRDRSGALSVGGEGEVVDWLVHMRRLPRERMLDRVIAASGGPGRHDLARLADLLAGFYRTAPAVEIAPPDYLHRFAEDILLSSRALEHPELGVPGSRVVSLVEALQRFLARESELLDARVRAGRIVEGHGDLRPEHICLLPDRPVIIDGLEFNRDFRVLDPADELSFLSVECERLGAPLIGPDLLRRYAALAGDVIPPALVAFYAGFRALLRARLAIWHLRDPIVRDRERWPALAREELRLAEAHVEGLSVAAPESAAARGTIQFPRAATIRIFLCGDVMTGRGIDQVLPHPSRPDLHEPAARHAFEYVRLAEKASGPIVRPVGWGYIWGDALITLAARASDARIINLETSVTTSDEAFPKGINYRMHPANIGCLLAAGVDACVLSNNHVLDWGERGLAETLDTLERAGIATAGAGRDLAAAARPAVLEIRERARVLVFGLGSQTAGIPRRWAAGAGRPGVRLLPDLSEETARRLAEEIRAQRRPGDIVVVSVHWGGNWGYAIPSEERSFARWLIDGGAVDVVHGHSSHHPKGVEVYRGRPILFGSGDFLNDYEGISGYEEFRAELVLGYFITLDPRSGSLLELEMAPFRTRRLRLEKAAAPDAAWLRDVLDRESKRLGASVELEPGGSLALRW